MKNEIHIANAEYAAQTKLVWSVTAAALVVTGYFTAWGAGLGALISVVQPAVYDTDQDAMKKTASRFLLGNVTAGIVLGFMADIYTASVNESFPRAANPVIVEEVSSEPEIPVRGACPGDTRVKFPELLCS
ncbi:MAG: hypothetical protein SFW62_06465 [Alphaproteobacteria bacterium]|nr:hypothetical protein [Alphaproteobacteria bacterium]